MGAICLDTLHIIKYMVRVILAGLVLLAMKEIPFLTSTTLVHPRRVCI